MTPNRRIREKRSGESTRTQKHATAVDGILFGRSKPRNVCMVSPHFHGAVTVLFLKICVGTIFTIRQFNICVLTVCMGAGNQHCLRAGHSLLVSLLRGRNFWFKLAVLRDSRREAGCAQRNQRFLARNIFRCSRKKKCAKLGGGGVDSDRKETHNLLAWLINLATTALMSPFTTGTPDSLASSVTC